MPKFKWYYATAIEKYQRFTRWVSSPYLRRKTFEAPRDNLLSKFFRELTNKTPLTGSVHSPFRIRQRIDKIWKG